MRHLASVLVLSFWLPGSVHAQQDAPAFAGGPADSFVLPAGFSGPPAPELPDTMSRDQTGQTTVRAVRLDSELRLDGHLDEAVYQTLRPITDFIQTEPLERAPATEKTELWILFDDDNVFVSARIWESQPDRMVVNEMRHDGPNMMQNESFSFIFDTFYDRRNAFLFIINPIGGRTEGQITNERQYTRDWNTVWDVKVSTFEGGWTLEAAVPFKSLRYQPGRSQIWGFNARRIDRWKNELSHLTAVPIALRTNGIWHASLAATMVGLEAPAGSKNLEIKPYLTSDLVTDRRATPSISNDPGGDFGADFKYGVTQNLTADFTYNTDFAQVEADEQQVNLTRFSLFFPEKRDFFLENQGLFAFAGVSSASGDNPLLFYSRRIGLNQGRVVPIEAGGRLTGRVGRYGVGLVNIQTDDEAVSGSRATNFSVLRLKRDVLRKSSIGVIATNRSVGTAGGVANQAYGVDGNFAFFDYLTISSYWARTQTETLTGRDTSYRTQLDYAGDRYGVVLDRLVVGDSFNPEVGFVRRNDIKKTSGELRFSPRPSSISSVRKFSWSGGLAYLENGAGRVEARNWEGEFSTEFQSSDRVFVNYFDTYEFVPRPFPIASDVVVPMGGYHATNTRVGFGFGTQRVISGNLTAERGSFYSGHKTTLGFASGRINFGPQLSVEPTFSVNWVDLREGSFTNGVAGTRVIYTITPLVFTTALVQYNSSANTVSTNARLRWEYRPGSEFFVVYSEERDTLGRRFPELANRSFIVKINRLLRF
jgi:hypothetical protein